MGVLETLGSQLSKAPLKTPPSQKLADVQPLKVENLANLLVLTVPLNNYKLTIMIGKAEHAHFCLCLHMEFRGRYKQRL